MLTKIRLKDFKSFVDEEVELAPLTLLVGANASGKSNFLDAVRFLHGLTRDLTLAEILNGEERSGVDVWPGIRGRAAEAARVGSSSFRIESCWRGLSTTNELCHHISCRTEPRISIDEESLKGAETEPQGESSLMSFLPTLKNGLGKIIKLVSFLDIRSAEMRGYGRRGAPLGSNGKNLSGVLADLCADPVEKSSIVAWLAELCAPELEDLDFIEVKELGDVMAIFIERGGRRISARSISDGTLHFLGTLLALRTAEPGSMVLIEEIETGLHPTRIRLLVDYLEAVTRERNVQVIATTHSPVILQWLSEEALRSTVVFGRVPDDEGTIMRRLGDLPHFNEVVRRQRIEELFTTGWLEMALWKGAPPLPGDRRATTAGRGLASGNRLSLSSARTPC